MYSINGFKCRTCKRQSLTAAKRALTTCGRNANLIYVVRQARMRKPFLSTVNYPILEADLVFNSNGAYFGLLIPLSFVATRQSQ